jgi:hypothetical protein
MAKPDVLLATTPDRRTDWQAACASAGVKIAICNRRDLSDALVNRPTWVLIDALIFDSLPEMQYALAQTEASLIVVLPAQASAAERAAVQRLPRVSAVFGPETALLDAAQHLAIRLDSTAKPETSATAASPSVKRLPTAGVRLAFWGTRGGVGVSTTAWQVAQILAEADLDVALFDTAKRGDLHLLSGQSPTPDPLQQGNVTIYSGAPTEEIAAQHQAIVIDGGRERGVFNAAWIELSRPPAREQIQRWALPEQPTANTRIWRVPRLIAIEVTD